MPHHPPSSRSRCRAGASYQFGTANRPTIEELELRLLLSASPPTLVGAGTTDQRIDLQWTPVAGVLDTVVERGQGDSAFSPIVTLTANTTSFVDDHLSPVTTYRYRLRQDSPDGTSAYSNIISASTLPLQSTTTVEQLPPSLVEESSNPQSIVVSGGTAFFIASQDPSLTPSLWRTDGTTAGTFPLGSPTPVPVVAGDPMLDVGGTLYLGRQNQLWKSDGTIAGTSLVTVLPSTQAVSAIEDMADYHGTLYFIVDTPGQFDAALWKSDGTAAGTVVVQPLSGNYAVTDLVATADRLFFVTYAFASGGGSIRYLWTSDGSSAGTTEVSGVDPSQLFPADGRLYFTAYNSNAQFGLWSTDGTQAETAEAISGADAGFVAQNALLAAQLGGELYFLSYTGPNSTLHLWKSDGTAAGTIPVLDLQAPAPTPGAAAPPIYAEGGKLYFSARNSNGAMALWVSDGSVSGTVPLATGAAGGSGFTSAGGESFFGAGTQLWKTDGTAAGTLLIRTFSGTAPPDSGAPENLTVSTAENSG